MFRSIIQFRARKGWYLQWLYCSNSSMATPLNLARLSKDSLDGSEMLDSLFGLHKFKLEFKLSLDTYFWLHSFFFSKLQDFSMEVCLSAFSIPAAVFEFYYGWATSSLVSTLLFPKMRLSHHEISKRVGMPSIFLQLAMACSLNMRLRIFCFMLDTALWSFDYVG